jgi:hypothetical protein
LAVARPIPTANDEVICSKDVLLLQYGYSDAFSSMGGTLMAGLLRKFAFVFSPSISCASLRHAMLAFTAAHLPFDIDCPERILVHSGLCGKTLISKSMATLNEADLFAALLLAYASRIRNDFSTFHIHVKGFGAILEELSNRSVRKRTSHQLSIFWPLARDLIIEASRHVDGSSCHVFEFCRLSQKAMGPQSYADRSRYWNSLVENDPNGRFAFAHAVFRQTGILRRCFRDTILVQRTEGKVIIPLIQSVVAEIQADLNSPEMKLVAVQLSLARYSDDDALQSDELRAYSQFILALYHFCQLMIVMMEGETVAEGTSSSESLIRSLSLLQVMQAQIIPHPTNIFPLNFGPFLVPRMLWISGLALSTETYADGKSFHPLCRIFILLTIDTIGRAWIIQQLERYGEGRMARGLEAFWKDREVEQIHQLLQFWNEMIVW